MNKHLIFQSDFGLVDGAVAAMSGVALSVDDTLQIHDLTHNIPPFDIFEASYRLLQAIPYWPEGSVFVSVIDPGVGSKRKSIVVKLNGGQYVVTPNNGTLTHIKRVLGIKEAREISEEVGRRKGSNKFSNTFHGRDIYAYTGALLASNTIEFEKVGRKFNIDKVEELPIHMPKILKKDIIGTIETLDVRFGSLWTNIPIDYLQKLKIKAGDLLDVEIYNGKLCVFHSFIRFVNTFAEVKVGEPLCYINSMNQLGLAINQGNFAKAYNIGTREPWHMRIRKK